MRTLRALVPLLLLSVGLAIAGLLAVRQLVPVDTLRDSNDAVGNYIQGLGTIYAVLLAFVVYVVWTQFNEARSQTEREANELLDLYRTANGFPAPARAELQAQVRRYLDAVLDHEWAAMAGDREDGFLEAWGILDDLSAALHRVDPHTTCAQTLFAEVVSHFNTLSDTRSQRLSSSRMRIPLALRLLIYAGAAIVVSSMYLMAVERFAIHAIITGAMAGAISHVLYVIHDLDDCFDGDWQVPRAPFERVRAYISRCEDAAATAAALPRESGAAS